MALLRDARQRRCNMFLILAIVLALLWAAGFFLMHVTSFFIHLLIILAIISLIGHLIGGRRASTV
jgi:hypothetical protein